MSQSTKLSEADIKEILAEIQSKEGDPAIKASEDLQPPTKADLLSLEIKALADKYKVQAGLSVGNRSIQLHWPGKPPEEVMDIKKKLSNGCTKCQLCCKTFVIVQPHRITQQYLEWANKYLLWYPYAADTSGFYRCSALGPEGCTCYENRPDFCHSFYCLESLDGGRMPFKLSAHRQMQQVGVGEPIPFAEARAMWVAADQTGAFSDSYYVGGWHIGRMPEQLQNIVERTLMVKRTTHFERVQIRSRLHVGGRYADDTTISDMWGVLRQIRGE